MRRIAAARRALPAALAAIGLLATIAGTLSRVSVASGPGWSALSAVEGVSAFRLGTAGRPFAWSTAVGDLNADGRPDYAVADLIGRVGGGFEYSVQFAISGRESQFISFNSQDAALSIALRDVDHDQDLDVVVSTVLSPSVVRVWLNDGRGTFSETSSRGVSPEWRAGPSLATDPAGSTATAGSTSRRPREAPGVASGPSIPLVTLAKPSESGPECLIASVRGPRRSRAPPFPSTLFL